MAASRGRTPILISTAPKRHGNDAVLRDFCDLKPVTRSVKPNRHGRQNGYGVPLGIAVECFTDMFEAALHRNAMAGKKGQLRRMPSEPFERRQAVPRRKLPNRIHAGV